MRICLIFPLSIRILTLIANQIVAVSAETVRTCLVRKSAGLVEAGRDRTDELEREIVDRLMHSVQIGMPIAISSRIFSRL